MEVDNDDFDDDDEEEEEEKEEEVWENLMTSSTALFSTMFCPLIPKVETGRRKQHKVGLEDDPNDPQKFTPPWQL